MEYKDFREDSIFSMKGSTVVWNGQASDIALVLGNDRGNREQVLRYLDAINEQIGWIAGNQAMIADMLVKSGMLTLAEDWISGAQELEAGEGRCFVTESGQKVTLPLTEAEFCQSLRLDSVTIDLSGGREGQSAELFLSCDPDYFAGHSILLDLAHDGTMLCRGLAG